MGWLKHAFAIDPPGPAEPDERQREIIDRMCGGIAKRHMTLPASMFLEISRPLNGLAANVMHFGQPAVGALFPTEGYSAFASFLERRGSMQYMIDRLESMEAGDGDDESMKGQDEAD